MSGAELQIITDSTADLPKELKDRPDVSVIPAIVTFGDTSFLDGVNLETPQFVQLLKTSNDFPTTAAPGTQPFMNPLAGEGNRICIHVGSKFSRFIESATLAAKDLDPEGGRISLVDSGTTSAALGFLVAEALKMKNEGKPIFDILKRLEQMKKMVSVVVAVKDLDFPYRGGRISHLWARVGGVLKSKPILEICENKIQVVETPRTWSRAIERMLELIKERMPLEKLAVIYCEAEDEANTFADRVSNFYKSTISLIQTGPALGAQGSPGLIAFAGLSAES